MPKIEVQRTEAVEVVFLRARCGVRYWEDATVNGEPDEDGSRIPFRDGDYWCPTITLETGKIEGWPEGVTADIHYKVCDDGQYYLLDAAKETVKSIDDYVPKIMCPKESGYGDYVIMDVNAEGFIQDWKVDLRAFEGGEE